MRSSACASGLPAHGHGVGRSATGWFRFSCGLSVDGDRAGDDERSRAAARTRLPPATRRFTSGMEALRGMAGC